MLTVSLTLPDADIRKTQPVIVSILGKSQVEIGGNNPALNLDAILGGPMFRLKGSILSMSFLDYNGALVPYSYEAWKDEGRRDSKL